MIAWPATAWRLLADTVWRWLDDDAPSKGAALAYYTVFSMAPLLLIVMALVGAFVGDAAARGEIERQLTLLIGSAGAQAVALALQATAQRAEGAIAAAIGAGTLLVGATSVFAESTWVYAQHRRKPQALPADDMPAAEADAQRV